MCCNPCTPACNERTSAREVDGGREIPRYMYTETHTHTLGAYESTAFHVGEAIVSLLFFYFTASALCERGSVYGCVHRLTHTVSLCWRPVPVRASESTSRYYMHGDDWIQKPSFQDVDLLVPGTHLMWQTNQGPQGNQWAGWRIFIPNGKFVKMWTHIKVYFLPAFLSCCHPSSLGCNQIECSLSSSM